MIRLQIANPHGDIVQGAKTFSPVGEGVMGAARQVRGGTVIQGGPQRAAGAFDLVGRTDEQLRGRR